MWMWKILINRISLSIKKLKVCSFNTSFLFTLRLNSVFLIVFKHLSSSHQVWKTLRNCLKICDFIQLNLCHFCHVTMETEANQGQSAFYKHGNPSKKWNNKRTWMKEELTERRNQPQRERFKLHLKIQWL